MPQPRRNAVVVCRIVARLLNTVLASAAIGLVASKLYVGGLCFTLSHTLACHWVFVSASLSITLGVGYSIIDFVRLPQEKPHRSSDFDEFFLKTSVMVSTLLTGIWVTSGCLIAKQFVSFTHENDKPTEAGEQDHHYIVTVLGIIAIVWCFATAIAWLSLTVYEAVDLRHWLREERLLRYGWRKLENQDEGYEHAEVLCKPTRI